MKVPTILVKQRIMLKKTSFICSFYDGYAQIIYEKESLAKNTFDLMIKNNKKVELNGLMIKEYYPGKSAHNIYKKFIKDIENAMKQNSRFVNIGYENMKGG